MAIPLFPLRLRLSYRKPDQIATKKLEMGYFFGFSFTYRRIWAYNKILC